MYDKISKEGGKPGELMIAVPEHLSAGCPPQSRPSLQDDLQERTPLRVRRAESHRLPRQYSSEGQGDIAHSGRGSLPK